MKTVFVFIPDTLQKEIGFLEGVVRENSEECAIYITSEEVTATPAFNSVGYCSENSPSGSPAALSKWVHINCLDDEVRVNDLPGNGFLKIYYDYHGFLRSRLLDSDCQEEHVKVLVNRLSRSADNGGAFLGKRPRRLFNFLLFAIALLLKVFAGLDRLIKRSATAAHLETTLITLRWLLQPAPPGEKLKALKSSNIIIAKFVDLGVGLFLLYYFLRHEQAVLDFVVDSTDTIIYALKDLLNFLMGSPAGLKLNFAFNKTLATFFFYHISLWRAFLLSTKPLLEVFFHLTLLPAMLGFSFQAALFEDLLGFVTFHVYCIYVYAARLYGVQIKGLVSLWRLFIGRKYNPLRERVDSCQYTHHQLFIGTLGFTIILFLLPTTLLYYVVFTTLRLGIVIINGVLLRLRYLLHHLPLYVTALWFCKSASVAGSIHFRFIDFERKMLHCTLTSLPLKTVINRTSSETLPPLPNLPWKNTFSSIFMGTLL